MFPIEKFRLLKFLGRGRFGHVYKYTEVVEDGEGEKDVAVKKLGISSESFDVDNCREIQTMISLNHVNVVQFLGYCIVDLQIALVMELCVGDLDKLIGSQIIFSEDEVTFLINQMCQGLAYLHQNAIIHRDVKPGNILIHCLNVVDINKLADIKQMVLKIADFGLAKLLDEDVTSATMTVVGTPLYKAPELRDALTENLRYSMRSDVYSLGLVAYNLLRKDLHKLVHKLVPGDDGLGAIILENQLVADPTFSHFLTVCLQHQADKRHTSAQLLQHPLILNAQFQNLSDTVTWKSGGLCTALHYSGPSRMIVGTEDGKLIVYDMGIRSSDVQDLSKFPILSIYSSDSFIAVGSGDPIAPVTILSKKDYKIVKTFANHKSSAKCIQMTNDFLVTIGDDRKMFVFTVPSWNKFAELTRKGIANYQCAIITMNVVTVIDRRRVRQYKLTNDSCKETHKLNLKEQLSCIGPDPTDTNAYWVGTSIGVLKKINLMEKKVLISVPVMEKMQVFQIKHLNELPICLLMDPKTKEFGPIIASYVESGIFDNEVREIVDKQNISGPIEASGEWLVHSDGEKLVPMNFDMARKKFPTYLGDLERNMTALNSKLGLTRIGREPPRNVNTITGNRKHPSPYHLIFEHIRRSCQRMDERVWVVHFTHPDLMVLGLEDGSLAMYKTNAREDMSVIMRKKMGEKFIWYIDSNDDLIAAVHSKGLNTRGDKNMVVFVLRKDNLNVVHETEISGEYPSAHLSNNFLVLNEGVRLVVWATAGWNKVTEVMLESSYYYHRATLFDGDVLTFIDGKTIQQFKLMSDGRHEMMGSLTIDPNRWLTVVSGKEELRCIAPDPSNTNEFWVGTDGGSIMRVDMGRREVLSRVNCGMRVEVSQLRCLKEFLLCRLFGTGWMILAYDVKDLEGLQDLDPPPFRHVYGLESATAISNLDTYGDFGLVIFYGKDLTAVTIDELRDIKKTESLRKLYSKE